MRTTDCMRLALEYLSAVEREDFHRIKELLAPKLAFRGPSSAFCTSEEFISGLERLTAVHVRNDIKRVFADGDEACLIYDFVTDTSAGALPTVEWLRMDAGRIHSINLYYDRVPWKSVMEDLANRAARPKS
jgi:hypothetical protein